MTASSGPLQVASFLDLFSHSAWRLELLPEYFDPATAALVERFAATGEEPGREPEYEAMVREAVATGRSFGRVHVIGELTDYLRWELASYVQHAEAGEDIRILDAARAARLDLPGFDFWLLDGARVLRMNYGERGTFVDVEPVTDPEVVALCLRGRDAALSAAMPLRHYLSRRAA